MTTFDDVRSDGTLAGCEIETYLHPVEYVSLDKRGFLRIGFDNHGVNGEVRVPVADIIDWLKPLRDESEPARG